MSREDAAIDRQTVNRAASLAPNEDTGTKPLSAPSPDNAAMPRFVAPSVAGELGRLGKYRVQKELGRGGMGAVYLAFDERLQRKVALKVLLPKAAADETAKERFLREARAAAQISSDYVVNIFEAEEIDGIPYIALQFLQGYPLDQYLKTKGNPTIPQTIRIGAETALGLAKAHKLGLVHRDIKPGNLWLEAPNGRVKILDFGLAKPVVGADGLELTGTGAILGTPAYMAPEQGMGKPVDGRADLFSLGCVLYRLCTGKLPFAGPTMMAVLAALATEEPTPVRELNPAVPEPLADLIRRLMAKNPADRPPSALAVARELDQISGLVKNNAKPDVSTSQPQVIYVPIPVTVQEQNPFAEIDALTENETPLTQTESPLKASRKLPAILVGSLFLGFMTLLAAGVIIIKITNKDGSVTELRVPDDSKIEVNGKTITPDPQKANTVPGPTGPLPNTYRNSIGMEFVKVPKGTAWLGGGSGKPGETKVVIEQDFYLGKYEVTQEEWEKVTGQNPSDFSRTGGRMEAVKDIKDADLKRFPVEGVSWDDCQLFIERLNLKEKESGWVYRLPKAAEWEYACRGGPVDRLDSAFDFYFARPTTTLLLDLANFGSGDKGLKRTCKVGSYEANPLGLYDMHGNVWEWCDDSEKASDGATHRVVRGGAWNSYGTHCQAALRFANTPSYHDRALGLRLARVPVPPGVQAAPANASPDPKKTQKTDPVPGPTGALPLTYRNSLGMEFVKVPKGTAWLGGGGGKPGETKVVIEQDFYLGKYEVTQEEWEKVTGLTPSWFKRSNEKVKNTLKDITDADLMRFPVENVSWNDCQLFIEGLNKKEKESGWVYRLPKEMEWEYACRGGPVENRDSAFDYYFAKPTNTLLPDQANFETGNDKGLKRTCKVGSYEANPLGLHDMHGNVMEWCDDREKASNGAPLRVLRGGSRYSSAEDCRAAYRTSGDPTRSDNGLGLRLARVPSAPASK